MEDSVSILMAYRPRWEYKWIDYTSTTSDAADENVRSLFSRAGADGWELVNTCVIETTRWRLKNRAIFKRQIDELET